MASVGVVICGSGVVDWFACEGDWWKDSATYRLDQWRTTDPSPPNEVLQSPCESLPHMDQGQSAKMGTGELRRVSSADCPCGHPTQTMQHILQDCELGPSVTKRDLYDVNQEALDWLEHRSVLQHPPKAGSAVRYSIYLTTDPAILRPVFYSR
ncbi:hypothetical protein Bbelb_370160 [Branchiostoma belcheri]|nr:hypothetical protein Bbelb_370160 [Branchiostoma belcheri]